MKMGVVFSLVVLLLAPLALSPQPGPSLRYEASRISAVINDLERRMDEFRRALDRALERSRLDGTRREDQMNFSAARLEGATDQMKTSWNRFRNPERTRQYARVAIDAAQDIHRTLSRHFLRGYIEREWRIICNELDRVAEVFHLPRVGWSQWEEYRRDGSVTGDIVGRISAIIADLERRTDEFRVALDRALDRSRLDGTRREDQMNFSAAKLEGAMDGLKRSWNRYRDAERSRQYARAAIEAAQDIHRTLARHFLRGYIEREWRAICSELDRLAEVYRLPRVEWVQWEEYRRDGSVTGDIVGRISAIIADLERRTDEFRVALDRALDRSRLDGTRREDQMNFSAAKLENAMDGLKRSWNRYRDAERSRQYARAAIEAAQDIHRTLARHFLRGYIEREWRAICSELDRLAEVYRLPRVEWARWEEYRR